MSIHDRLSKKQLHRFNILDKATTLAPYTFAPRGGVKPFICWALAEFEFSDFAILPNLSYFLFVVLNLFQHLTNLEDLLVLNKILNSLKITDNSPNFLRFQNDISGWCKNNPRQTSSFNTSMEGGLKKC